MFRIVIVFINICIDEKLAMAVGHPFTGTI